MHGLLSLLCLDAPLHLSLSVLLQRFMGLQIQGLTTPRSHWSWVQRATDDPCPVSVRGFLESSSPTKIRDWMLYWIQTGATSLFCTYFSNAYIYVVPFCVKLLKGLSGNMKNNFSIVGVKMLFVTQTSMDWSLLPVWQPTHFIRPKLPGNLCIDNFLCQSYSLIFLAVGRKWTFILDKLSTGNY